MEIYGEGRGGKIYFIVNNEPCGLAFDNIYPPLCPAVSFYADGEQITLIKDAMLSIRDWTHQTRKQL